MRYREPFTVFPRKLKSGKTIYYYRTYDQDENRTTAKSTGEPTKSRAREYCRKLKKAGKLIPSLKDDITFSEYAKNWWIYDKCQYIQGRLARRGKFSHSHADNQRNNLENHILPTFEKMKLSRIKTGNIEKWLLELPNTGISPVTANNIFKTFRIMIKEAYRLGYISEDPIKSVKPLLEAKSEKGILEEAEVKKLLDFNTVEYIWRDKLYFACNLLSASTGLRLGEIQGLQSENLKYDIVDKKEKGYIHVCNSYERKYGLKETKTGNNRDIPLPDVVYLYLKEIKSINPSGYLLSITNGKEPIHYQTITDALYSAMRNIGITEDVRKKREITFHSWRHYFNSLLRNEVSDSILQQLTGHKTTEMTDLYTHYTLRDFDKVRTIQNNFFKAS